MSLKITKELLELDKELLDWKLLEIYQDILDLERLKEIKIKQYIKIQNIKEKLK